MGINKRKLRVHKRRALRKVRALRESTIFIKLALLLILFLASWSLGRYQERKIYESHLAEVQEYTTETYYFIEPPEIVDPIENATSELYLEGEVAVGRCLTREGVIRLLIDKVE